MILDITPDLLDRFEWSWQELQPLKTKDMTRSKFLESGRPEMAPQRLDSPEVVQPDLENLEVNCTESLGLKKVAFSTLISGCKFLSD